MNEIVNNIIKVAVLDIVGVLSLFVIIYFAVVLINIIRNGKQHKITKNSIMTYSFDSYMGCIKNNCNQLAKWIVIVFAVHLTIVFFDSLLSWIQSYISYDKIPVLALAVDIIAPIFKTVAPVFIPFVIILGICLVLYALLKAGQQVSRKEAENKEIIKITENATRHDNVNNNSQQAVSNCKYKLPKGQVLSYFTEDLQHGFIKIIAVLPKLFIIFAVCVSINSLFLSFNNITKVIDNYKRIDELNITIKNLSNSEAFARISLMNELPRNDGLPLKTYKIDILDQDGDTVSTQTMQLQGNEIVIDSININFDYSKIAKGEKYNIAYPYRVYSETMAPASAKPLSCIYNDKDIPVIYCLEQGNIYGIENDVFYSRLSEIFEIIKDENLSREIGIRSTIGNALHFVMHKDDVIDISIEGTGGISASPHKSLFDSGD